MSEEPENRTGSAQHSGFDRTEPGWGLIALLGAVIIIALVAVIFGLQFYHDRIKEEQVYVKVLAPESETLQALRAREDEQLHSYQYLDRDKGLVRLPIERAMELLAAEYAAGEVPYPTTPYPIKKEEPEEELPRQGDADAETE